MRKHNGWLFFNYLLLSSEIEVLIQYWKNYLLTCLLPEYEHSCTKTKRRRPQNQMQVPKRNISSTLPCLEQPYIIPDLRGKSWNQTNSLIETKCISQETRISLGELHLKNTSWIKCCRSPRYSYEVKFSCLTITVLLYFFKCSNSYVRQVLLGLFCEELTSNLYSHESNKHA